MDLHEFRALSDDELAADLGVAVAEIQLGQVREKLSIQYFSMLAMCHFLADWFGVAISVFFHNKGPSEIGINKINNSSKSLAFFLLVSCYIVYYRNKQVWEADELGFQLAARAGYDLTAVKRFPLVKPTTEKLLLFPYKKPTARLEHLKAFAKEWKRQKDQ